MKSHELIITKLNDKIEVSCSVKVMLPINDEYVNDKNYNLIQKYLYIKMALKDNKNADASSQSNKKTDKNKHHNKHPHKRHRRQDAGFERIIPTTFIEVELREGPYSIFPDSASTNVSCTLGLIDYDDTIPFENLIFKVVQGNRQHNSKDEEETSKITHTVYNTRAPTSTKRKKLMSSSSRLEASLFNFSLFGLFILFLHNFLNV
jgi:hypothetical protein